MLNAFTILLCLTAAAQPADAYLPRIAVRADSAAPFYLQDTGATFHPRGFNHVVLEHGDKGWHALFNVGVYNSEAAEETLSAMATLGANVVRVWAWGVQNEGGFTSQQEGTPLNPAYMANFMDFLRRASAHGIYVMPILDEVPVSPHYMEIYAKAARNPGEISVENHSAQYLNSAIIAAKARCAADFVAYIAREDKRLLSTVFGWALANEVCVQFSEPPFSLRSGSVVTATGRTYDMASEEDRQRCWDETVLLWAREIAEAIRGVDPEALVTAGMWTSDAHGRLPVNGLVPDGKDPRIPPRPSVLGGPKSALDFIDVHIYPWDGTSTVRRDAHERDLVVKPALVGEYGVFKNKTSDEARVMMGEMLDQAYAMGYAGDLHWVWDLRQVAGQTWSAVEEGIGEFVMRALASVARRNEN